MDTDSEEAEVFLKSLKVDVQPNITRVSLTAHVSKDDERSFGVWRMMSGKRMYPAYHVPWLTGRGQSTGS